MTAITAKRCVSCRRTILVKVNGRRICLSCQRAKRAQPSIKIITQGGYDVRIERG